MLRQSILVLDDESDIVFTFKRSLEISGFPVFGFTDPYLALEHFASNSGRYSLILTDVRMPRMNGLEFAQKVRMISSKVKILLMSAFDMKDLAVESSLEISELLQKPLSPIELNQIISRHVGAGRASADIRHKS